MGDSTIISKKILMFAVLVVCVCSVCTAQSEAVSSARIDEQQYVFRDTENTEQSAENTATQETGGTQSTAWQIIKTILVLALVVACIYGVVFLLRKTGNPAFKTDPYLKKVASLPLAPGKSVCIVSTPTQAFMVGVSDNAVSAIGEITDKDLINMMNLNAEKESPVKPKDFSSVLSSFFPNAATSTKAVKNTKSFDTYFSDSATEMGEQLRQKLKQKNTIQTFDERLAQKGEE